MTKAADSSAFSYNYDHFGLENRTTDHLGWVAVGQPAPDFTATRLDGTQVKLSDFRGKPVVLETGSASCPMYVSHVEPMNALALRYPDVEFLVLYVREAHPGQRISAHRDNAQKAAAARMVVDKEREGRTILVDDLAGSAHQLYGAMPNTVHVIGADGVVAFRAMWNDPPAVEAALRKVLVGQDAAAVKARFRPAGMATVVRVLRRAGSRAMFDFVIAFPKIASAHLRARTPRGEYRSGSREIEQLPGRPIRFTPRYSSHPPVRVFGSWAGYLAAARKVSLWRMVADPLHREEYPWFRRFRRMNDVGSPAPNFALRTPDGATLRLSDLRGRIAVFMFAALTCPPARAQLPLWNRLHADYADRGVTVFVVYSRERHPGEPGYREFRHTRTDAEKEANARLLAQMADMPVVVDGIDEAVLARYGKVPNAAFVVDRNGVLAYKSTWADAEAIRAVLDGLL